MLCAEIVSDIQNNFCTQHVLPMFCKKKSFWKRFTCIFVYSEIQDISEQFSNRIAQPFMLRWCSNYN